MNIITDTPEVCDLYTVLDNIGHPVTSRKYYRSSDCDLEVWDFVCQALVNHTDPDWHAFGTFDSNDIDEICELSVAIINKAASYVGLTSENVKVQSASTYDLEGTILLGIKKLGTT